MLALTDTNKRFLGNFQTDVNDAVDAAFIRQQEINNNDPKARRLQETFDNSIDMPSERSHGAFAINFFYQAAVRVCTH